MFHRSVNHKAYFRSAKNEFKPIPLQVVDALYAMIFESTLEVLGAKHISIVFDDTYVNIMTTMVESDSA